MMRYRVEQLERDSIHSQIRALQQNNATLLTQIQQTNATLQTQIQQGSSNYTANAGIIIAAISVVATTVFGLGGIILTIYLSKKS
ncbi:unnamed protein product [Meloidogyne enterolobii]|uniref:Uncharacterized protein n=1 Tax=Meloidogyne enterolobii TaxID=390850 RepID=A0ACB1AED1_MELEN